MAACEMARKDRVPIRKSGPEISLFDQINKETQLPILSLNPFLNPTIFNQLLVGGPQVFVVIHKLTSPTNLLPSTP